MRVTQNTSFDQVRDTMQKSKGRMEKLQMQGSTLKKLNTPSDDPVGSAKVLETRTDKVNIEQFQTNAKLAETFLNHTDHAISELSDIVVRAKEIALSQASGASANNDTRLGIAEEVQQLYQQAIVAGNRRIGDRFIFGGYKTDRPPLDSEGRFQGDRGQMMVEVARDAFVSMNVPGVEVFNTQPQHSYDDRQIELKTTGRDPASLEDPQGGRPPNINLFDEIDALRIALLSGDIERIRGSLESFDQLHAGLVAARSRIGSRMQGLASVGQSQERHAITNAQLTQHLEDADLTQVMSNLAKEESVFKSVLASGQKLIQPTLLDFLR